MNNPILPLGAQIDSPAAGQPQQLLLLLLAAGQSADLLAPLASALREQFAQAAIVTLPAADDLTQAEGWVRAAQAALGVSQPATALFGFGLGAQVALALVHRQDGLAGRVVAFGGDYPLPPDSAPTQTTLHWLHGDADPEVPTARVLAHLERLAELGADATLDVADGVGRELAAVLIAEALRRLRGHIPARTWREALGAGRGDPQPDQDDEAR